MDGHGSDNLLAFIDSAYSEIVSVLNSGALLYVSSCRKNLSFGGTGADHAETGSC